MYAWVSPYLFFEVNIIAQPLSTPVRLNCVVCLFYLFYLSVLFVVLLLFLFCFVSCFNISFVGESSGC